MTNSRDPNPYADLLAADDAEGLALATDLETMYSVPIPNLRFDPSARGTSQPTPFVRHWRPVPLAAAAAVALGAVLLAPGVWGGDTETVSAQEILDRATAQASASSAIPGSSYHFVATFESGQEAAGKPSMETWYVDADHVRTENVSFDGTAEIVFGLSQEGDRSWMYMNDKDGTRAVSFPSAGVLVDPFAANSLADVLAAYSAPGCQEAINQGTEQVAGRTAYVVLARETPETCETLGPDESVKRSGAKLGDLRLWVDAKTFLTLRAEKGDGEGGVGYYYEVISLEVGGFEADDIAYTPPPGASVAHVDSLGEAKSFVSPSAKPGDASLPEATEQKPQAND